MTTNKVDIDQKTNVQDPIEAKNEKVANEPASQETLQPKDQHIQECNDDQKIQLLLDLIERAGMDYNSMGPCESVVPNKDEDGIWRIGDDQEQIEGTFEGLYHWLQSLPENAGYERFWNEASELLPNELIRLCRTCNFQSDEDPRLKPNQVLCLRENGPKCSFKGNEPKGALGTPVDENDTCDWWELWIPEDNVKHIQ